MIEVRSGGDLASLAPEWEALADRVDAWPDQRPGWIESWWGAFGNEGALVLLEAREGGGLTGVLPLLASGDGLSAPANWETSRFGPVADSPESSRALAGALFARRPARVLLRFLDPADLPPLEAAAREAGYLMAVRVMQRAPYLDLPGAGGWEELQRRLGKSHRSHLRRRRRRLEEQGEVRLDVEDGSRDLDRLLDEGFEIEGSGWKVEEGSAILSRPETVRLYKDAAAWAASRGFLRLAFLRVEGRCVAFDYCFEVGRSHYLVKTGFDRGFERLAPGNLLRYEMIRRAHGLGLHRYEFLGGLERYKLDWTDDAHDRLEVRAHPRGVLGGLRHLVARGRPVARRLLKAMRVRRE